MVVVVDGGEGVDAGERGEGEAGGEAVEGGRRGVDGVEEEVAAVAGGKGEGEAGGGEVAGQGIVGGREAVEVGRRGVGVEGEVAGQGEASPPGRLAEEWVGCCSLPGLVATSEAAVAACLGWSCNVESFEPW